MDQTSSPATKLFHILRAKRTLKLERSPRTLVRDLLCTDEHTGPYKLQGGAASATPSEKSLSARGL